MEGSGDNKKLKTDNDDDDKELQQIRYRLCRLWGRITSANDLYSDHHLWFLCEIGPHGISTDTELNTSLLADAIQECNSVQGLEMEQYMLGVLETAKN
jgi:hypothetical protein